MSEKPISRIHCPNCGRRLVFVAAAVCGDYLPGYVCDCMLRDPDIAHLIPEDLISLIVRAREWDDGSVVISIDRIVERQG